MNTHAAYALLGVPLDATHESAKAAYRARARLVHPDAAGEGLREHATSMMSDINRAWEIVSLDIEARARQPHHAHAFAGPEDETDHDAAPHDNFVWSGTDDFDQDDDPYAWLPRDPVFGECQLCGFGPVAQIKVTAIRARVFFSRRHELEAWTCRPCAVAMYRDAQYTTLTQGWWGFIAVFFSLIHLVENWNAISSHRPAGPATSRPPNVVTPATAPLHSRSLVKRPGAYVGPGLAFTVALTLLVVLPLASASQSGTSTSAGSSDVGTCLDVDGWTVDCDASDVAFRIIRQVESPSSCTGEVFRDDDGGIFCTVRVRR